MGKIHFDVIKKSSNIIGKPCNLAANNISNLWAKKLTSELKILLFYLLIYAIFDISEWITASAKKNNLYLHNINEWIGMLITGWLYHKILESSSAKKKIVVVLTLIAVINSIFKFSWEEIAGYSFTLNKVVIITFVFLHFHSIITEVKVSNILKHPPFLD